MASHALGAPGEVRRGAAILLFLMLVQFMLGMTVNLFVQIPSSHPGSNAANYFGGVVTVVPWALGNGNFWLRVHVAVGLVLLLGALLTLVRSTRAHGRWLTVGILGFIGVLAAGFNSASFLIYHEDFSSMLMATGFTLAMGSYIAALAF
jgi:hypothetical protein